MNLFLAMLGKQEMVQTIQHQPDNTGKWIVMAAIIGGFFTVVAAVIPAIIAYRSRKIACERRKKSK
jgi:hypothetical protein